MADRGTFLGRYHPTVRRRAGAHSLYIENAGNCSSVPRPQPPVHPRSARARVRLKSRQQQRVTHSGAGKG